MSYVKFMLAQLNIENGGFTFESLARDLIHADTGQVTDIKWNDRKDAGRQKRQQTGQ